MPNKLSSKDIDEALERLSALTYPPVEGSEEFTEIMHWYDKARKRGYKKGMAASAGLIARLYTAHRQFAKLLPYLKEMRELCEENGKWTEMYADCLIMSIEADCTFGRFDEAVADSNIFLRGLINEIGPVKAVNSYVIIGHLYQMRGWYIRALRVYHQGMTRMGELQQTYNAVGLLINYAHALYNVKQYDSSMKEFQSLMERKDIRLSLHIQSHCHFYLSQIYAIHLGDTDRCIKHFDIALKISREHDVEATTSLLLWGHASSLNSLKRYEEALALFQSQNVIEVVKDNPVELGTLLNGRAWSLLNLGRAKEAWTDLQQVEEILKSTDDYPLKVNYYKNCAFYYWQMQNQAEAKRYTELQQQAQEKANSQEFAMQLEQVNAIMELDKKQWELEKQKLKQEKMEQELNYASQEKEMLNAAVQQRNALIDEFQSAIKKIERSDMKRAEIFKELSAKIVSVRNDNNEVNEHDLRFNEKYKKSSKVIGAKYPTLSAAEIKIAILLASGLSNKEIASMTLTTTRNIENHRLQLRKKMKLKQGEDLVKKLVSIIG